MSNEDRIEALFAKWLDLNRQGIQVTAEDLCHDCPELLEDLTRTIAEFETAEALAPTQSQETSDADSRDGRGEITLGRYRLDRLLGAGGFGQVWRAYDPELRRDVAIKVPHPVRAFSAEEMERLLSEAQRLAQLNNEPGIVSVYDVGHEGDLCFIVSELIEGGSLSQRMAQGRVPHEEAARLVAAVAEAVHQAHLRGFTHRDIKPGNILLDQDGQPHLCDFGLAVSEDDQLAERAGVRGTYGYMSPEQASGGSHLVDARADVYSLGVVLYQLLTQRLPYKAKSRAEYRYQVVHREPRPPRTVDDTIPRELESICLRCLTKSPAERLTTAADVAAELRGWLAAQENPPTPRWFWGLVAGAAMGLVALFGYVAYRAGAGTDQANETITDSRMWSELPEGEPVVVVSDSPNQWEFDSGNKEFRLDGPNATLQLLSLGKTKGGSYHLQVRLKDLRPGDKRFFAVGVFFGCHDDVVFDRQPCKKFQAVRLVRPQAGETYRLERVIGRTYPVKDGSLGMWNQDLAVEPNVSASGEGVLELEIGPTGLESVRWDKQTIRTLTKREINEKLNEQDYNGDFGVMVWGGTATFSNPRVKHP